MIPTVDPSNAYALTQPRTPVPGEPGALPVNENRDTGTERYLLGFTTFKVTDLNCDGLKETILASPGP